MESMAKPKAGEADSSATRTREISVHYKVLLCTIVTALGVVLVARLVLPCVIDTPTPEQIQLFADLSRWVERLLTALVALLAGKVL